MFIVRKIPFLVAPLVGAWIEIPGRPDNRNARLVAPLVGAWIEISGGGLEDSDKLVAPLVGAWIEMSYPYIQPIRPISVAPLVGAWIEISCSFALFLSV